MFLVQKDILHQQRTNKKQLSGLLPRVPSKQSWKAAFQRFPHSKGRRVSSTTRPCTRELLRRLGLGIFWVLLELALELLAFQGFLFGCYRLLQYAFWLYDFACSALTGCLWTDAKPWWCLPCGMLLRNKLPRDLWVCSHTGQRQTFGGQELEDFLLVFGISKLKLFCLESEMRSGRHHVATLVLCSRSLVQSQICQLCVSRFNLPWSFVPWMLRDTWPSLKLSVRSGWVTQFAETWQESVFSFFSDFFQGDQRSRVVFSWSWLFYLVKVKAELNKKTPPSKTRIGEFDWRILTQCSALLMPMLRPSNQLLQLHQQSWIWVLSNKQLVQLPQFLVRSLPTWLLKHFPPSTRRLLAPLPLIWGSQLLATMWTKRCSSQAQRSLCCLGMLLHPQSLSSCMLVALGSLTVRRWVGQFFGCLIDVFHVGAWSVETVSEAVNRPKTFCRRKPMWTKLWSSDLMVLMPGFLSRWQYCLFLLWFWKQIEMFPLTCFLCKVDPFL